MFLGKPKISNYSFGFVEEDVREFEISVQKSFGCDLDESADNVFGIFKCFFFRQSSPFLEESTEVSFIAVLGDNVAVRCFSDHIKAPEYILMFEFGKSLDFAIQHFSAGCIFNSFHVDSFDGYGLI